MSLANSFARSKRRKSSPSDDKARAKPLRMLGTRAEWLGHVEEATALIREHKARDLETRARAVGKERRAEWREERKVWRDRRTGRTADPGDRVHRVGLEPLDKLRVFNDPRARAGSQDASYVAPAWAPETVDLEERMAGAPELTSRWHQSRANTKRELFQRVENCGSDDGTKITLVCRGCKTSIAIPAGCNSHWFCAECRAVRANKFRADFERKRLGLVAVATRAGLTRKKQKKSERWGERLLTLTIPSVGSATDRIRTLRATWLRFWRTLREQLRPTMQTRSGITLEDIPRGMTERALLQREEQAKKSVASYNKYRKCSRKIGPLEWKRRIEFFPAESGLGWQKGVELSHWDVLSYLHVFEWTMGDQDGLGHPHMHVWLFSRYMAQPMLELLWRQAYAYVTEQELEDVPKLVVDIRAARPDVAHELVKYLTKDWELTAGGAKRVAPEVFAELYAELDGKRMRQSSSGLSNFAVAKVCACPSCGYERERGHWARVDIEHALEKAETFGEVLRYSAVDSRQAPLTAAHSGERRLRAEWLQKRASTEEHRANARRWSDYLAGNGPKEPHAN